MTATHLLLLGLYFLRIFLVILSKEKNEGLRSHCTSARGASVQFSLTGPLNFGNAFTLILSIKVIRIPLSALYFLRLWTIYSTLFVK